MGSQFKKRLRLSGAACALLVGSLATSASAGSVDFSSGLGSTYVMLFEGGGNNTLQITNVTASNGDIGVANTGKATVSGPSTINGAILFSAANSGQFSNNNASNVITGGVSYSVPGVTSAINFVNALNSTLGAE